MNIDEGITVLSCFDGMSCGMIALDRLGIKVKAYYASEIDKPAMKVAKHNWPDIIHIGDVTKVGYFEGWLYTENGTFYVGKIDLLIGGSPCQGFSFAGKQLNFEDPRSKLFFEYVRILRETEAEYFMLENVKMKKEYQHLISEYLKHEPTLINSSLVSAQNRNRLYWSNIAKQLPPKDRGIVLKDILFEPFHNDIEDKSLCLSAGYCNNPSIRDYKKSQKQLIKIGNTHPSGNGMNGAVYSIEGLAPTLTTNKGEGNKIGCIQLGLASDISGHDINRRIYAITGKSPCLTSGSGGNSEPKVDIGNYTYRKLLPIECERLQTIPDNYTSIVSNTQRYKMLGNGWTVDVICHLLEPLKYGV